MQSFIQPTSFERNCLVQNTMSGTSLSAVNQRDTQDTSLNTEVCKLKCYQVITILYG